MVRAGSSGTDFDWLMAQLIDKRLQRVWTQLYDAAEIPLVWDVAESRYSKSRNMLPVSPVCTREAGVRKWPRRPRAEIQKPLKMNHLPAREGTRLIDVAMASLAARYRETYHFNYANPHMRFTWLTLAKVYRLPFSACNPSTVSRWNARWAT